MAYPENCFTGLIGIHGTCEPQSATYWFDDIPGIDLAKLSDVAEQVAPTGEKLGMKLIETAARLMAADVEAIYDGQYKVANTLVNGCTTCKFTTNYTAGVNNGLTIKNNSDSFLSNLLLDKFTVKINNTGTFNMVIDDGLAPRVIEHEFEAGVEYEFTNLNFRTRSKVIRLKFQETEVLLAQLSCPRSGSNCGCGGGGTRTVVSDLQYTGLTNDAESQNAFGFIPCAGIMCDAADLLCYIANSAPRMIGMALLYKAAELYFSTRLQSSRNNKIVGTNTDAVKEDVSKYSKLYKDKLNGVGTRGVKDIVFTTLQNTGDVCVVCNAMMATAWAST
jgi:hypothetical protein